MPKSWSKRAPKTKLERKALFARCGTKAFLDPKNLKFPVMAKSGPCVPDCAGVEAAYSRAKQFKRGKTASKARRLKNTSCRVGLGRDTISSKIDWLYETRRQIREASYAIDRKRCMDAAMHLHEARDIMKTKVEPGRETREWYDDEVDRLKTDCKLNLGASRRRR